MTIKNPRHLKTGTNSIDPRHIEDFEYKVCIICKKRLTKGSFVAIKDSNNKGILNRQRTEYVKHTSFFENSLHGILEIVHPKHKRKLFYLLREGHTVKEIREMVLDEEIEATYTEMKWNGVLTSEIREAYLEWKKTNEKQLEGEE